MCETSFRCGVSFDRSAARRRRFRRLRAASFFPGDGKETNGPGHPLLPLRGNPSLAPSGQFTLRIAGGRLRMDTSCPYSPTLPPLAFGHLPLTGGVGPRSPITGVTPWTRQKISGAQNLSECPNSRRATGPWVCKNCGWCGSTSAPGFAKPTLPVRILAGRSGTGPYEANRVVPVSA